MHMKLLTDTQLDSIQLQALAVEDLPIVEMNFDESDFEYDCSILTDFPLSSPVVRKSGSPLRCTTAITGTIKVSIRIPALVLAAFKAQALATGKPYQSLAIQALRRAALGWRSTSPV